MIIINDNYLDNYLITDGKLLTDITKTRTVFEPIL